MNVVLESAIAIGASIITYIISHFKCICDCDTAASFNETNESHEETH